MAEHSVVDGASASNPKSRYQEKRSKFFSRSVSFPLPLPPHNHEPTNNRPYSLGFLLLVCLPACISFLRYHSDQMYAALCLLLLFSLQKISISGIILLLLVHFSPLRGWCLNDGLLSCLPIQFPSSLHGKKKIWVLWRIRYQIPTPHTAKQNGEQWRPCWTFLLKWEHAVLDGYYLL